MPTSISGAAGMHRQLHQLSNLPGPPQLAAAHTLADLALDDTQSRVHVITGRLKASGRVQVRREPGLLIIEVIYGEGLDYAVDELYRGGDHDFLAGLPLLGDELLRLVGATIA